VRRNPLDVLLMLGITVLLLWMYGTNLLTNFGYSLSDQPVHNYWINEMSKGNIFAAGVYPFGFHCMLYYLHALFGIPTYVLLRVFYLVQTIYIHWILLLFLKACLRTGYAAYLGTAWYITTSLIGLNAYYRFSSTLPQEFGMMFILPCVYFGFAFFRTKRKAALAGFAMSFSLTFAVHFYNMMIAGLFCLAMAAAYAFRFLRKQYFGKVIGTCLLSVVIAVLPMGIAFALGTPLEGSLRWGMSIIQGSSEEEETDVSVLTEDEADAYAAETASETIGEDEYGTVSEITGAREDAAGTGSGISDAQEDTSERGSEISSVQEDATEMVSETAAEADSTSLAGRLLRKLHMVGYAVWLNVFRSGSWLPVYVMAGCLAFLVLAALLFFLRRQNDYAAQLLCVALYMALMCILIASSYLGIPALMDSGRASIYFAYSLAVLISFAADAAIVLLLDLLHLGRLRNLASLAVLVAAGVLTVRYQMIRTPYVVSAMETNDAITCLTNILRDSDDWTFTICSANDEYRMAEDYGYHYEIIDLLNTMENDITTGFTIPTKYVYFFVEKVPIDYFVSYENSGQRISKEGAKRDLPYNVSLNAYQGENRWIVMSRLYYWAEAFREMYPDDMTIYYESDDFICYRLVQNINDLFDLEIDYGYNHVQQAAASDAD
jgi:hypothetical protein